MLKPQLIDMIRSVPETAIKIWAGGPETKVVSVGDKMRITFEGRSTDVIPEVYFAAERVVKGLQVRWMGRMLRSIQDVLELRHAAEDSFLEDLFEKTGIPRVLFVPAGVTASGYYRAMIPADMMYEGGKAISHWTASIDLAKALRYDVLWIQLITSPILAEIARHAKSQGVKIVYDIDDRLDSIPEGNQAAAVYTTPEKQRELDEILALADLVTVSTEPLATAMRARGVANVRVLRNQLTANVMPRRHRPNPAFTRILWAGSPTHKLDLAIIAGPLARILKRHNGKVRFTCLGERLPEALADCQDWIDMRKPVDFELYHDELALIAADFAIAPLVENTFNESKSAIKALEYASAGYPMLLSPVGEYPSVVRDGLPAELVANDDWESAMERMIALTPEAREELGKRCTKWVCANRCIASDKGAKWIEVALELVPPPKKAEPKLTLVK